MNLSRKLIKAHLLEGEMAAGREIAIRIDQTLTQDSTGTMAFLQFEAMGLGRVRTERSVAYVDHNMLQAGPENADDHRYLQTAAYKYGVLFSKPGNGICHQVHLERFSAPGKSLLGSDSHTPTCGAAGMLAIGAGGLDVAVAMAGGAYHLVMPRICRVELLGALPPMVGAKDVILEVLRQKTVKGGVGFIMEYTGAGLGSLSVPERATIANMGAELGATTSVFPSDGVTRAFLKAQGRENEWVEQKADEGAEYDEEMRIDLSGLAPLAARPHSPDNVVPVREIAGLRVDQVAIGSCTNSSYADMMKVAAILKGRRVPGHVSLVIAPGSRQVLAMLAESGALKTMLDAGARILEAACGPCIGMGQAPATDGVSLRTFNRNFQGRSGTPSANVYLVSPETAAASAIAGALADPRDLPPLPGIQAPAAFDVDDSMVLMPGPEGCEAEVVRGPNIRPFPKGSALPRTVAGEALIKLGDNITTDHIMPSGARLLPFRSNIEYLSAFCLTPCDADFPARARARQGGFIVGGANYGQGSSREHAALAPLQLGVKGVLAKSFARIHAANLINNGILPLEFVNPDDYEAMMPGDEIEVRDAPGQVQAAAGGRAITIHVNGRPVPMRASLSARDAEILVSGGLLNLMNCKKGA